MSDTGTNLTAFARGCKERRKALPDLGAAWMNVLGYFDGIIEPHIREAGLVIVAAMNAFADKLPIEPLYHNRHHTIDVIYALSNLIRRAVTRGIISKHEANLALIAMVGHDLLHDGTMNTPIRSLERIAGTEVARLLSSFDIPEYDIERIVDLIHKTDPAYQFHMRGRLASGDAKNPEILALIVGDADLFASILPDIGLKLSDDLAKEWQMAGLAIDPMPNTQQGRRNFLAAIKILAISS